MGTAIVFVLNMALLALLLWGLYRLGRRLLRLLTAVPGFDLLGALVAGPEVVPDDCPCGGAFVGWMDAHPLRRPVFACDVDWGVGCSHRSDHLIYGDAPSEDADDIDPTPLAIVPPYTDQEVPW